MSFRRWNQKAAETLIPAHFENRPVFFYDLFVNREDLNLLVLIAHQRDEPAKREVLLNASSGGVRPGEVSLLVRSKKSGEPRVKLCFIRDLGEVQTGQAAADYPGQLKTEVEERQQAEAALQQTTVRLQETIHEYGRRNRDTAILREMSEVLQACQSAAEAYPLIARFARDLFPNTSGSLFVLQSRSAGL